MSEWVVLCHLLQYSSHTLTIAHCPGREPNLGLLCEELAHSYHTWPLIMIMKRTWQYALVTAGYFDVRIITTSGNLQLIFSLLDVWGCINIESHFWLGVRRHITFKIYSMLHNDVFVMESLKFISNRESITDKAFKLLPDNQESFSQKLITP